MKYTVLLWCPDCTGQDDMGCFGGVYEILDKQFDSREDAEKAGHKETRDSIWRFDVEKEDEDQ